MTQNISSPSEISPREWFSINRSVNEIKKVSAPCVSAYISGDKVSEILDICIIPEEAKIWKKLRV